MKSSTTGSRDSMAVGYAPSEGRPDIGQGDRIDARYRIVGRLGRGGMADVYHVVDERERRELALKRHRAHKGSGRLARMSQLFEREYAMLAQIDHPSIIRVYDYGFDDGTPYYTMERLEGQDLRASVPADWRTLCAWLRQIASALALLHSRRLIHRDVTPHNIRITSDGAAKLIDFGAMTWMGFETRIVGTPPFIPPETVNGQSLDGRSDLFALGATAYWALMQRHAFPARSMKDLPVHWRQPPPEPTECHGEPVPQELVALVMSLLSLEPSARPGTAAEVMDRLGAIAGLPPDEHLAVAHAYLSTPTLVGRNRPLGLVRRELRAPRHHRGAAVLIEGVAGTGRSRFIDACALQAKLLGLAVVRADASDAMAGDYGVAGELVRQLEELEPNTVRRAATARPRELGPFVPDAAPDAREASAGASADPNLRGDMQQALLDLFAVVSKQRPLCIAVDDVHRVDEPSLALLAMLAQDAAKLPLVLVVSADGGVKPVSARAMQLLGEAATHVQLAPLTPTETEELVRSLFGDVPHVDSLAGRIHELSRGNPRGTMEIAQHLVRREVLRYEAGAWSIPGELEGDYLPASLTELLADRLAELSPEALELAELLTLSQRDQLGTEDYPELLEVKPEVAYRLLEELVAAQVLIPEGLGYRFVHPGWIKTLREQMPTALRQELHVHLADFLARRGTFPPKVAAHLLMAQRAKRALEVLLPFVVQMVDEERVDEACMQTEAWVLVRARQLIETEGATREQRQALCSWLTVMGISEDVEGAREAAIEGLQLFAEQAGLTDFHALDPQLPAGERLKRALGLAQARYERSPEAVRGVPPAQAIKLLARHVVHASGLAAANLDGDLAHELPSLEPLGALSPMLQFVEALRKGSIAALTLDVRATDIHRECIALLDRPDRAGLQPHLQRYTRLGVSMGIGLKEAALGKASALEWAAELETEPLHAASGWRVRSIYYMSLGDDARAASALRQVERLLIQRAPHQRYGATHVRVELWAQAVTDDLMGLKRSVERCERLAASYPSWQPFVHYARAHYLRVLGNLEEAQAEVEQGLALAKPGRHILWPPLAAADVELQMLCARPDEAVRRGERHLATAKAAGLEHVLIEAALVPARAQFDPEGANELVEGLIAELGQGGSDGVLLGMAWEARARVAIALRDDAAFDEAAKHCAEAYRHGHSSLLSSKYERLLLEAKRAGIGVSSTVQDAASTLAAGADLGPFASVVTQIATCFSEEERQVQALTLLMEQSGASLGHLFEVTDQLEVRALRSIGETAGPPPASLFDRLRAYGRLHFGASGPESGAPGAAMETLAVTATTGGSEETSTLLTWDQMRADVFLLRAGHGGHPMQAAVLGWAPTQAADVDDRLLRAVQTALSVDPAA